MFRDVMQNASLETFAEIGLLIFFVGFLLILAQAFLIKRKDADHLSALPLADDDGMSSRGN